ncbi:hypothetical protein S40293_10064 [Stachybotrys chartarum IBT 40293]|nr:hypothetical protein S40293_10064 [Stachybotrys chartarum IBT 40293]
MATQPAPINSSRAPLRILSLDGGGVRGISSLYILQEIMAQVRRQYNHDHPNDQQAADFLPAEYFDLICGTSTGGLIALMLGRLRMGVKDAINQYQQMSEAIFTSKSEGPEAAFDKRVLEQSIKNVIASSSLQLDPECELKDVGGPRTFVVSKYLRGFGSSPVRMRSYSTFTSDPFDAKIWEVARATSAAPTFFEAMTIDGIKYSDGGTGWNNPTSEAIAEADEIWPNRPIGCIVSMGTGLEDPVQLRDSNGQVKESFVRALFQRLAPAHAFKVAVAEYCVKSLTSCERVHADLSLSLTRYGLDGGYFRLNVPQGMSQIGLEEWNKLDDIKALTKSYLSSGDCQRTKVRIAKILLYPESTRRTREKDRNGRTALHRAALGGNVREIEAQMDIGADIDVQEDRKLYTPLICAITMGHLEACRALLAFGADINKSDQNQWTPLIHSINSLSGGMDSTIFALCLLEEPEITIDCRDNRNRTALFHATVRRMHHLVIEMIQRGADVDIRDEHGKTALYFAVLSECIPALEALCEAGANINTQDAEHQTPLHWAVKMNFPTALSWLLRHGANRDVPDSRGKTALQLAEEANATDCIDLLKEYALTNQQASQQAVLIDKA